MSYLSIPKFCKLYKINVSTVYRFRYKGTGMFAVVDDRYFVIEEKADALAALCRATKKGNPNWRKRK